MEGLWLTAAAGRATARGFIDRPSENADKNGVRAPAGESPARAPVCGW